MAAPRLGERSGPSRIERAPLGKQIADGIRGDILFGRITPGEKLRQQQLCEEYGTSRMPVRDALRQLTYEGFLVTDEGGHSVVARLHEQDLLDIYVIEGLLHGLAARRVAEQANEEKLADLGERHRQMVAAQDDDDVERMARLNWEFHRRINQLAESPKLSAALRTLALSIPKDYVVEFPRWMPRANKEHGEILEAMASGNGDRAEQLMRSHVEEAGRDLVDYLKQMGLELG